MNTKNFLIPFVAVLILLSVGIVSADLADNVDIEMNGEEISAGITHLSGISGDVVPVRVAFTAGTDSKNVKVKVGIYDGRDEVYETTGRFNVVDGHRYVKLLSLELPSDLDETHESLTLTVEIYDADHDTVDYDEDFIVEMQRESYEFDVLSIDYTTTVSAGEVFPVSVVVENTGFERLDDGYVVVSIPELGVSARGYFGDLVATEACKLLNDSGDFIVVNCDDDDEDSLQKTVYLKMPENAQTGVYELQVEIYNKDTSTKVRELIKVDASASTMVLAAVKNQDMKAGETKIYDVIIVNSGDDVQVYNIQTIAGTALAVSAPSVVTVGPDSSTTVAVSVTAASGTEVGTYTFSVDVNGEQVTLGANVTSRGASTSVVALTVVLVIIFVVLLIVLIVLLTRKDKPIEEVETSYY